MAQKLAKKKINASEKKDKQSFTATEVGAMLKNINTNIDRLIDGHQKLDQKIDRLDEKLSAKIDGLDNRIVSLERRIVSLERRMDSMEQEMKSGFGTIIDFMEAIDSEVAGIKNKLETKVDKDDYTIIERRVTKLEFQANECQKMIDAAKKP
jgi:hypothetical protein